MDLVNIFIRSAFVDNMIFAFFFGMCSYLAVSKTVKTAVGLGFAVIFVLTVTIPINYLIENYVLKEGALTWMGEEYASVNLNYLTFIMFISIYVNPFNWKGNFFFKCSFRYFTINSFYHSFININFGRNI